MTYTIKNEYLQVSLDSKGAEMTSLVDKAGINYLWTADPKHWARHAPVLFPIVGKLKNNRYTYRQKEYSLGQHGFARDMEFEVLSDFNSSVEFLLKSSPYTKEKFPFDFELSIRYALEKNKIHIFYNVRNKDTLTMLFSIGAHPGFRCPLYDNESINDYYIQFNKSETAHIMLLNHETGLFERETAPLLKNEDKIFLDHTTFENDALVFKGLRSTQATIKNHKNLHSVTVGFEGFPYLGLWSKPGAPFVCIEPWFGHADFKDSDGSFESKEGLISLKPLQSFECSFFIQLDS